MTAPVITDPREALETLERFAVEDLLRGWPAEGSAEDVRDQLLLLSLALGSFYGAAAATLAADWYDELREGAGGAFRAIPATLPDADRFEALREGAGGAFRAIPATLPDADRFEALARWATGPLFSAEPDVALAQSKASGGLQRIVGDAHRDTVIGSLRADRGAKGWERRTTGKSCEFCVLIAGRGAVYSASSADFSSHDHCDCIAVPVFGGDPRPVREYTPSQRFRSGEQRTANNERIRDYLRANPQTP